MFLYVYFCVSCAITAVMFGVCCYYRFKCRKKDICHDRNCRFTEHCDKYKHIYTDEELERINKMLDEM